jgi:hypothetical protein
VRSPAVTAMASEALGSMACAPVLPSVGWAEHNWVDWRSSDGLWVEELGHKSISDSDD